MTDETPQPTQEGGSGLAGIVVPVAAGALLAFGASKLNFHPIVTAIALFVLVGAGVLIVRRPGKRLKPLVVITLGIAGLVAAGWAGGIFTM